MRRAVQAALVCQPEQGGQPGGALAGVVQAWEEAADPARAPAGPAVALRPLSEGRKVAAGEVLSLTFEVVDRESGRPLPGIEDLQVLTFRAPGHDQRRQWAEPVADGVYGVELSADRPGAYYVFARSRSLGLSYAESPFVVVTVER